MSQTSAAIRSVLKVCVQLHATHRTVLPCLILAIQPYASTKLNVSNPNSTVISHPVVAVAAVQDRYHSFVIATPRLVSASLVRQASVVVPSVMLRVGAAPISTADLITQVRPTGGRMVVAAVENPIVFCEMFGIVR